MNGKNDGKSGEGERKAVFPVDVPLAFSWKVGRDPGGTAREKDTSGIVPDTKIPGCLRLIEESVKKMY